MRTLAMSQVMAGANFWDAKGHQMSNSNDIDSRKEIFAWIARHEDHFYQPRSPIDPVGVYFSQSTRNYYPGEFIKSFRGMITLLMQKHWEFQVVTPRTLSQFKGKTLVLPDVRVLTANESTWIKSFADRGGNVIATGATPVETLGRNVTRMLDCPGKAYLASLQSNFSAALPAQQQKFLEGLRHTPTISIEASPSLATSIANVNGKPHIYFANFTGIEGGKNVTPSPAMGVRVRVKGNQTQKLHVLPFLGEETTITGVQQKEEVVYTIPRIELGAAVWLD